MPNWDSDQELFNVVRNVLYTSVVGDIMDTLGLVHQFLSPQFRPVSDQMVIIGRAMPVLEEDLLSESEPDDVDAPINQPFGLMLRALDDLKQDEVYICTGSSMPYALWGELMSTRAFQLGAAGAVVDGFSRDTLGVRNVGLPVFSHGSYAQDQLLRGRVADFRVAIRINGVLIQPGDIVFGDLDGVCVVPSDAEEEVFQLAVSKANQENTVRKAILSGMSTVEAFERYRVM